MVKIVIFALQLFAAGTLLAQTAYKDLPVGQPEDTMAVRVRLEELFQHVRSGDVEKASSYIVYRGKDTTRSWKDVLHYKDPGDRKEAERVCKLLSQFLTKTGSHYQYQLYLYDKFGPWYVWNLSYDSGGNTPSVSFAFRKIGNAFCLADIDE